MTIDPDDYAHTPLGFFFVLVTLNLILTVPFLTVFRGHARRLNTLLEARWHKSAITIALSSCLMLSAVSTFRFIQNDYYYAQNFYELSMQLTIDGRIYTLSNGGRTTFGNRRRDFLGFAFGRQVRHWAPPLYKILDDCRVIVVNARSMAAYTGNRPKPCLGEECAGELDIVVAVFKNIERPDSIRVHFQVSDYGGTVALGDDITIDSVDLRYVRSDRRKWPGEEVPFLNQAEILLRKTERERRQFPQPENDDDFIYMGWGNSVYFKNDIYCNRLAHLVGPKEWRFGFYRPPAYRPDKIDKRPDAYRYDITYVLEVKEIPDFTPAPQTRTGIQWLDIEISFNDHYLVTGISHTNELKSQDWVFDSRNCYPGGGAISDLDLGNLQLTANDKDNPAVGISRDGSLFADIDTLLISPGTFYGYGPLPASRPASQFFAEQLFEIPE